MAWVITRLCIDRVSQDCVEVCPVDCIYEFKGAGDGLPNQLFIDPHECILCGLCEMACPWEAIFEESEVPDLLLSDILLNSQIRDHKDDFQVPEPRETEFPSRADVKANRVKWGLT